MDCPPLFLSDKVSTIQLLPLLTLWLLAPESEHVFYLAFDKFRKVIDYNTASENIASLLHILYVNY